MGIFDKAENKAQDLAGQAKEKIGEATDNKDLQAEGVADQGEAGLKDVGYKGTLSFETFNAIATREHGLAPELLKLLASIGRQFSAKIEG